MALEEAQAKRLLGMARAAVPSGQLTGTNAPSLTAAYAALRIEITTSLEGELEQEFERLFPELEVVAPAGKHPRDAARFPFIYASAAEGAAAQLRLVAGWLEGVIDDQ